MKTLSNRHSSIIFAAMKDTYYLLKVDRPEITDNKNLANICANSFGNTFSHNFPPDSWRMEWPYIYSEMAAILTLQNVKRLVRHVSICKLTSNLLQQRISKYSNALKKYYNHNVPYW